MSTSRAPQYFTIDIHTAAKDNDMVAAEKFFEEGGDPNVRCRMQTIALHRAAFYGHLEMCVYLMSKGCNIEACDPNDQTPLFWAAKAGHLPVVQLLLDRGSYINAKDKKDRTPLFEAASNGHAQVVELLLRRGAKTDIMDADANEPGEEYKDDVPSAIRIQITNMIHRLSS